MQVPVRCYPNLRIEDPYCLGIPLDDRLVLKLPLILQHPSPRVDPSPAASKQTEADSVCSLDLHAMSTLPNPEASPVTQWSGYVKALYQRRGEPPLGAVGTVYTDKLEKAAREKLKGREGT